MLIAFVLLGKNLELRAKLKAASDMTGLLNILPTKARLLVDSSSENPSYIEVSCNSLSVGDTVIVLPGVSGSIILNVYHKMLNFHSSLAWPLLASLCFVGPCSSRRSCKSGAEYSG